MAPLIGIFAPQYYGTVQYYMAMARCQRAIIDMDMRYDKRFKSTHRCLIVDAQGPMTLTVPVAKPAGARLWRDVTVSSHGQWWQDHRVSLESAYGRTPFFEFYIDRFLPFLRDNNMSVSELDRQIDAVIRRTCAIETEVGYSVDDIAGIADGDATVIDYRRNDFADIQVVPYYQVRAERFGFIGGQSILDLIFNMGTEAPLILSPERANVT